MKTEDAVPATDESVTPATDTKDTTTEAADNTDAAVKDAAVEKAEETAIEYVNGTLKADGGDYHVTLTYTADAKIPADATLSVTEIPQGSDEYNEYYQKANAAVASESTEEGKKTVDFARFFDITILDNTGAEIEPAAFVDVAITYDDAVAVDDDADVKVVHFDDETKNTNVLDAQAETTATPEAASDAEFSEVKFSSDSFSVFGSVTTKTLTGGVLTADGKTYTVTITYDEDAGIPDDAELSVREIQEGTEEYQRLIEETNSILYASENPEKSAEARFFDISILSNGVKIEPNNAVQVSIKCDEVNEISGDANIIHFGDAGTEMIPAEKMDGGVIFDQDSFSIDGIYNAPLMASATTLLAASSSSSDDSIPAHSKTLTSNDDGTYQLSLSVTGKGSSSTTKSKADVIVVFDISGSMDYLANNSDTGKYGRDDWGNFFVLYERTETTAPGSRSGKVIYSYKEIENGSTATTVYRKWGNDYTEYTGTRYSSNSGETRLDVAKAAIATSVDSTGNNNSLAAQLLSNNEAEATMETAAVTLSLVTFSNKASVVVDKTTNLNDFKTNVEKIKADGGTNWEDALLKADSINVRNDATAYVIFVSDGDPTYRNTADGDYYQSENAKRNNIYGYGNDDPGGHDYNMAKEKAKAIVNKGKKFYTVGVFGILDNMSNLAAEAYGQEKGTTPPEGTYQVASDKDALNAAFSNIINSITNSKTYKDVEITDNLTSLTATTLVNGDTSNFTYTQDGVEWSGAPKATYENGKVTWKLSDTVVENGVTYTVSFDVWPSQEVLDLVAELNNGKGYNTLTEEQKSTVVKNSDGTYSLKTNTDSGNTVSYTRVETTTASDGTKTETEYPGIADFTNPDPIPVPSTKMVITKAWEDSLTDSEDQPSNVTLSVLQDSNTAKVYKSVTLERNSDGSWPTATIYIAPGIKVAANTHGAGNDGVLESGYIYTVTEPSIDNHYELNADPVQPMMNGLTTDDTTDLVDLQSNKTWTGNEVTFTATNTVKDGIYITKKVVDSNEKVVADCDEEFTFTITLHKGTADGEAVSTSEFKTAEDGTATSEPASGSLAYRIDKSDENGNYVEDSRGAISNGTVTLTMSATGRIRIVNVPKGIYYTVTEVTDGMADGYEYVKTDVTGTTAVTDARTSDQTYSGSNVAHGVTRGNTQQSVVVTNKQSTSTIGFKKVDADNEGTLLENAVFTLSKLEKVDGTSTFVKVNDITSSTVVQDRNLVDGTYRLVETTAPDGYLSCDDIYFKVSKGKITLGSVDADFQFTASNADDASVDGTNSAKQVLVVKDTKYSSDGDYTLTVNKLWKTKATDTKESQDVKAENIPFTSITFTVNESYKQTNGDTVNLPDRDITVSSDGTWTTSSQGMAGYTNLSFKMNSETAKINDQIVDMSDYDWSCLEKLFTVEKNYGSLDTLKRITTCASKKITIPAEDVVLVKLTSDEYMIWMPYDLKLTDTEKETIKKAFIAAGPAGAGNLKSDNISFYESANMNGVTVQYQDNKNVKLVMADKCDWAQIWYGGFANKTITMSLTNELDTTAKTQVEVTKIWEGDESTDRPESITIDLKQDDATTSFEQMTLTANDKPEGDSTGNTWAGTFKDLPKYDVDGTKHVYKVSEESVAKYTTTYDPENQTGDAVTITNTLQSVNIVIRKTNENGAGDGNYLSGAKFKLYKSDGTTEITDSGLQVSDTNGYVTPEAGISLKYGTYYLEETEAPAGYNLPVGKFKLVVDNNGASVYTYNEKAEGYTYVCNVYVFGELTDSTTVKTATVIITNSAGEELPMTGGSGTTPYTLGGLLLMAMAAWMYVSQSRRNKERRSN